MNDPEEFHVIIVGRAGGHDGSNIMLIGPGSKRDSLSTATEQYRKKNQLATNIQLMAYVAFSGDKEAGEKYHKNLMDKIAEEEAEARRHNIFATGEKVAGEG